MTSFRTATVAIVVSAVMLAGMQFTLGTAYGAPAPAVARHRHFIIAASGEKVYVGPNFCDVAQAGTGFAQFHANVHLTDPGAVDVRSEGCGS